MIELIDMKMQMRCILFLLLVVSLVEVNCSRNFTIDYDNNTFLKDGKPFRYISGSIHYNRLSQSHWKTRLLMMKSAGLNTITTYLPWNYHEPRPGVYDFTGNLDVFRFLDLANSLDLPVILRVGPYTCAGWDFGGLAGWLMSADNVTVRTNDPVYMTAVYSWLDYILPKVRPVLYENGGPVISLQIENEYGSFGICDHVYLKNLRDRFRLHLGPKVVLFTTDGSADNLVECGKIEGVYATVDFGLTDFPEKAFAPQRKVEPKGPLVCSEFYVEGVIDYWGRNFSTLNYQEAARGLDIILAYGANVNLYMMAGGTNFAYYNGGGYYRDYLVPVITSYDHDSPITEGGKITPKYLAIRKVIQKYTSGILPPVPPSVPVYAYGGVTLTQGPNIFESLKTISPNPVKSQYPVNMEKVGQYYGFILYRHTTTSSIHNVTLQVPFIRDRAHIFINKELICIIDGGETNCHVTVFKVGQDMDILVENQGRLNAGIQMIFSQKGLIRNVTLDGKMVRDWTIFPLNLDLYNPATLFYKTKDSGHIPGFYFGNFQIPSKLKEPQDTYIDVQPFRKGQLFINGVNIGRYWPWKGPQVTLYVPKSVLKPYPGNNIVVLFELDHSPCDYNGCSIKFVDEPKLNKTVLSTPRMKDVVIADYA
ncbi:hypothetical protein SNE40_022351 [Patella caerulea]|uniref:Beta-galactosidase n=1 Tax=Patella caerulea TaxID=87958 RepID=A0AAN8IVN7_PATCE